MQVAIFDFDGTLYEKETFNSLMKHLEEHPNYQDEYKKFYRDILSPFIGNKLKVYTIHKIHENSMQLYVNDSNSLMKHLEEHPNYQAEYKKFYRDILPPFIGHKLKVYPTHKMRANSMQLYVNALDRLSANELNMFFSDLAQKMRKDFNPLIIERF